MCVCVCVCIGCSTTFCVLDFCLSSVQLKSYPPSKFWMKWKPNKSIKYSGHREKCSKTLPSYVWMGIESVVLNRKWPNAYERSEKLALLNELCFVVLFRCSFVCIEMKSHTHTHKKENQQISNANLEKINYKMNLLDCKRNHEYC